MKYDAHYKTTQWPLCQTYTDSCFSVPSPLPSPVPPPPSPPSPPPHTHKVDSREEVGELLSLDKKIDLVIPRGGNALVRSIMEQAQGRIPVLGHADGVCHVYVDQDADIEKAKRVGEGQYGFSPTMNEDP